MKTDPEAMRLLRDTLERYVKDLAEELLYWVEELNKLDAGELPAEMTGNSRLSSNDGSDQWQTRRQSPTGNDWPTQPPGKAV